MSQRKPHKSSKPVHGHGIKGDICTRDTHGKELKSYRAWHNMLKRCYNAEYQATNPTYLGCTVCEEWKTFSAFKNWFDANYRVGLAIDKDILVHGNRIYSAATCVFVPPEINSLLTDHGRARGLCPQGVYFKKSTGRYVAQCGRHGKGQKHLGLFDTPQEASDTYQTYKRKHITKVATRFYLNGEISSEVKEALLRYEVRQ